MFNVVLYEPEIPPNTGNIGRLTLGTDAKLFIVGEPTFDLKNHSKLKRAGLDYWEDVKLNTSQSWSKFKDTTEPEYYLVTKFADKPYFEANFEAGDNLIFGGENKGVPENVAEDPDVNPICLPMSNKIRSYNVCNSVAVVLFEAIKQTSGNQFSSTEFSELDQSYTRELT